MHQLQGDIILSSVKQIYMTSQNALPSGTLQDRGKLQMGQFKMTNNTLHQCIPHHSNMKN